MILHVKDFICKKNTLNFNFENELSQQEKQLVKDYENFVKNAYKEGMVFKAEKENPFYVLYVDELKKLFFYCNEALKKSQFELVESNLKNLIYEYNRLAKQFIKIANIYNESAEKWNYKKKKVYKKPCDFTFRRKKISEALFHDSYYEKVAKEEEEHRLYLEKYWQEHKA